MGWHRGACTAAIFLLYHLAKLLYGHFSPSHLEQRAYDSTYHIAQEAVGLNHKAPFMLPYLLPLGLHDATVVGNHIGM